MNTINSSNWYTTTPIIKNIWLYLHNNFSYFAEFEQNRVENVSNILYLFISAHLHAQIKIPYYFGENPTPDTIEQAQVVLESNDLVKLATSLLLDLHDILLEYRKSKEKVVQILSLFETMLLQFKEEAVITNSDLHHFQDCIKNEREKVDALFSNAKELKRLESIVLKNFKCPQRLSQRSSTTQLVAEGDVRTKFALATSLKNVFMNISNDTNDSTLQTY